MRRYTLNNAWQFRLDPNYVLLFERDPLTKSVSKTMRLHPTVAAILTFFNGERSTEEIAQDVSYILDKSPEEGVAITQHVLSSCEQAMEQVEVGGHIQTSVLPKATDILRRYRGDDIVINPYSPLYSPIEVMWNITWDCPRRCIYCFAQTNAPTRGHLPLARALSLVDEMADMGVAFISIGGGDPFTYPGIIDVLARTCERKIDTLTSTKCRLSETEVIGLREAGIEQLQVSLDSADPEIAEFLTGSSGYVDDVLNNLQLLRRNGIKIRIKAVMTPYNYKGAGKLIDFLVEHGASCIKLEPYGRSAYRHRDDLFFSRSELQELNDLIHEAKQRYPEIPVQPSDLSFLKDTLKEDREAIWAKNSVCGAMSEAMNIHPDGRVLPCEQVPIRDELVVGDVTQQSLWDIWRSPRAHEVMHPARESFRGQPCYDCEEFDECIAKRKWCMRDAYRAYLNTYAPSPKCPRANGGLRLV